MLYFYCTCTPYQSSCEKEKAISLGIVWEKARAKMRRRGCELTYDPATKKPRFFLFALGRKWYRIRSAPSVRSVAGVRGVSMISAVKSARPAAERRAPERF